MQAYQRFELRIPNSLNTTILPKDDAKDSAQTLRNAISAMASPTYRNTNHHHGQFSQKILQPNLTPKRSRPVTRYNPLKALSKSSEKGRKTIVTENNKLLKESNEVLQRQRGISQENFCRSPVPKLDFKERLSPEVSPYNNFKNARTHLLEEPQLLKNSSQQLLEKNNHWNQHSIFQTSRSIIPQNPVDCERYENYGGFTTFRRELWSQNTINAQEIARKSPQMMDQINETNWQTKATCSRRLSFEGNEKTQPIDYLRIKRVEDKLHKNLENENNKVLGKDSSRGCSQAETRKSSRASLAFENNTSQREKVILENRGIKELKINPFNENESTTKESVLIFSSGFASPCGVEVFGIKDKNKKGDPEEEEIKLRKMMMELKQKIIEKDMEIFELKNGKKKDEIETKALKSKLNQVSTAKKQSEDCLEQAMQHVASQEREINFLNVKLKHIINEICA